MKVYVVSLVDQFGREVFRYQANGFYAMSGKPHAVSLPPGRYSLKTLCRVTDETPMFSAGSFAQMAFRGERGELVMYRDERLVLNAGDDIRLGAEMGPRFMDEDTCEVTFRNLRTGSALESTSATRYAAFDALLKQQRYDHLLFQLVPEKFYRGPMPANEVVAADVAWLRSKSQEGHVPLLYVLGFRVIEVDPQESTRWLAWGRVFGRLDGAECVASRVPWSSILEQTFPELGKLAENERPFRESIDEALKFDQGRMTRPPSTWYCDGGVLPEEQRKAKREERRQAFLESNNKRLGELPR